MTLGKNNLSNEKSSYLQQHKDNPIHWQSFSKKILEQAQKEDKPIFLSIGYSSCHWCHVMASESFEDEKIATLLNENFINIKIDKEEFPDIDQQFQMAAQVTSGQGGWPLSAFVTPDMKPYFVGTYFPKHAQKEIPSFEQVIIEMNKQYKQNKEETLERANNIEKVLIEKPSASEKVQFDGHFPAPSAVLNVLKSFEDEQNGGYGAAPKFPQFSFYEYAVEQILEGMIPEEQGKHIVTSLEKMMMGGVFDQARGGIHRYSKDEKFLVPHFEKMLYDQAALLKLLTKLSLIYPAPVVYDNLILTLEYLETEMKSDKGYFFSAQGADSEGVEGLYFCYSKDEFIDALTKADESLTDKIDDILDWFNIQESGNFNHGMNVISLNYDKRQNFYKPENWEIVRKVKRALVQDRATRIPPMTDSKGVSSWNFQLMSALLDVVQYCRVESIASRAYSLVDHSFQKIHESFIQTGEFHRIINSTTHEHFSPLFENYVFFTEMQLRFYELSGSETFKDNAIKTFEYIMEHFFKDDAFYTRSTKQEFDIGLKNIHAPIFDQSYKSAFSTFFLLVQKWDFPLGLKIKNKLEVCMENIKHLCLQNPLGFGETLRAFTYPEIAFKKVEVPRSWVKESKIQDFLRNFSVRFAITYTDDDNKWQICNHKECELSGSDFESFKEKFVASNDDA